MRMIRTHLLLIPALLLSTAAFAKDVQVTVKGMVCSFCAQGIKKKFSSEEAVKNVDVNLENHLVTLQLKEGAELTDAKIQEALKDAGYTVEKIDRK